MAASKSKKFNMNLDEQSEKDLSEVAAKLDLPKAEVVRLAISLAAKDPSKIVNE